MKNSGDDGYHDSALDEKLYSYFLSKSVDWQSLGVSPRDLIDKIMAPVWKIITTDPKMIKFNDMMKKLRIQPSEIDAGNVGTDIATGKKFLIIDISIFDDIFEENKKPMTEMKFTINEIRRIIAEEAELVLESRRARNWIAQQDEFFRKDFLRAYDAGVTNIPDLAFLKPPGAQEVLDDAKQAYEWPDFEITDPKHLAFIEKHGGMDIYKRKAERFLWRELRKSDRLREDEPILRRGFRDFQAFETFYNPKVRNVLASNDVNQLKDFETATLTSGQDFSDFMNQMKSAFIDPEPISEPTEPSPEIEQNPEGFKTIGNVGDFELIDPSTGEGSAHCAVGTEWCTRQASTYNTYTEGSLRLYYIFNDNLEYPHNKVALGIKDGKIQYGGYGGTAVVANDQGIENREELEEIFGGDTDEIVNKLTAYYGADLGIRKEQVVNYIVFL